MTPHFFSKRSQFIIRPLQISPANPKMCQVTAKTTPLTPIPPPPPSPTMLLNTKAQPYAPSPPPPPCSKMPNSTQAQPLRPKSRLNPHAEPFSPLTNSPFIPPFLAHSPAVSLSYRQGQGSNNNKKQKKQLVFGHVKRQMWAPKKADSNKKSDGTDYQVMFAGGNTTLMIKNIPNRIKRHDLLQILDCHCLEENMKAKLHSVPLLSEYDFLYLPIDFGYGANLGYAFVNFTTTVAAMRFAKAFDKHRWEAQVPGNKKICEISLAVIQGIDDLKNHFERITFSCHTDGYLPVMLSPPRNGWNCPNPTVIGKRIDTVRQRKFPLVMRRRALIKSLGMCESRG